MNANERPFSSPCVARRNTAISAMPRPAVAVPVRPVKTSPATVSTHAARLGHRMYGGTCDSALPSPMAAASADGRSDTVEELGNGAFGDAFSGLLLGAEDHAMREHRRRHRLHRR